MFPQMDAVECFCTNARRAALALTALYDQALAPHGLKVTQLSLLRAVLRNGECNLTELAAATGLDRSTIGRNLRLLGEAGFIGFTDGTADQRNQLARLTPDGKRRLRAASVDWQHAQHTISTALGADADRLLGLTRRVAETARAIAQTQEQA